ncbi:MAG: prolipoprotein diacylglyceryl transferase [Deltaproteobacteria bacterium]|nr:prolipoprotein diacylglyceryl transferase [Syntrophaceae bacterium]NLX51228.1 prolipoprotein diacylglyceryl transferase [Deltaproteobacteria bacterium]
MDSFVSAWQHLPSHISPVLFSIGSFQLRYYSLMYLVAFAVVYGLFYYRIRRREISITAEHFQDYLLWAMVGLIVGARLGYALFYNFSYYLAHPLEIILPFDFSDGFRFVGLSGMSYHGGLIGVVAVTLFFCRRHKIHFWRFGDWLCAAAPLGYLFGRIGNFLNGELWGRATTVPWGMVFPLDATGALRHPSQLYEALFEGLFLFVVLWSIRKHNPFDGFTVGLYIFGYGLVRFFIEFFREPDAHLGFVLGFNTMGQVLCVLMMLAGMAIILWRRRAGARAK